ncbi:hypothetical protein BKA70DRAFT_1376965 [Coprinopsis sp. MPI-PUGE-AT-0042]|nr:hypothetical protein BKA70DRAFT_1376965 [Coprinopsis sp. MPI-PUGE-AT-0042]
MTSIDQDRDSGPLSEWTNEKAKSKVPLWLPISAFVGTSLALAIPMLMVRRSRNAMAARVSLHGLSASAPPRRIRGAAGSASAESTTARLKSLASTPATSQPFQFKMGTASEETSVGSLTSAMSKLNLSNAMFAAKAFAIATTLVTVTGFGLSWSVKLMLGIENVNEFGVRARRFLWSAWPSLTSSIHRPPQGEGERQAAHQVAPFGSHENWTWQESEKRLKRAYDEGGFPLWAQTAVRELEAEARVERAKRQREIDALQQASGS